MNKQMENFSISPPINLLEDGKWLKSINSFEATNSVFNITDKIVFQLLYQVIGRPNLRKKLLTN